MNSRTILRALFWAGISALPQLASDVQQLEGSFQSGRTRIDFDEFRIERARASPAILMLHGARGLRSRNFPYRELATRLAHQGFLVVFPHYLNATGGLTGNAETNYPTWVKVTYDSLEYLMSRSDVDKNKVGLFGFSLGASIALAAASQGIAIGAVVECAGSLPDDYFHRFRTMPPLLILHNASDPVVPVGNARQLARLCELKKLSCQVNIGSGTDHGLAWPRDRSLRQIQEFLATHLMHDRP